MDLLDLRSKALPFKELYYLCFIMILNGLASAGFTSEDWFYKVMFVIALIMFCLKMLTTNFDLREYIWMSLIAVILVICLYRNQEKTLILSMLGIFGCKDIPVKKVIKYALYSKLFLTIIAVSFSALGIITNEAIELPKGGEIFILHCYGYYSPNTLFANLFLVCVMAIAVYQRQIKLWGYMGLTLFLYIAYKVLMCRTGLVVWVFFLGMIGIYSVVKNVRLRRCYLFLIIMLPVICTILTFGITMLYENGNAIGVKLDALLTGRIAHISRFLPQIGKITVFGHIPREPFDSMYVHLYFNYGIVLFTIFIVGYIYTMYYAWKKGRDFELIILGVMSVYGFMEQFPLNITWNLFLLYMSWILFKRNDINRGDVPNVK